LIWATVAALPPLAEAAAEVAGAAVVGAAEEAAGALALALDPDDEPPLLLQAATVTAGSRANAVTEISRTDWSRI
jgi:hypothetical protein